jgi:hypothetical protein
MQEWFEADAADGFLVIPGVIPEGMDSFVDAVNPVLQQRGLFRTEYEGETLRDNPASTTSTACSDDLGLPNNRSAYTAHT